MPNPGEHIAINEVTATAEMKKSVTGETVIVFDPPYAMVLFAEGINRRNPELKFPENEPAGDWLVTYNLNKSLTTRGRAHQCHRHMPPELLEEGRRTKGGWRDGRQLLSEDGQIALGSD
ncbi:hypothetical protein TSTA_013140 [Talaromyces stipitatus ATCC 10500]|uniref:Uncharacterized protein n=1 Tax=Talaromyces stipitatus (strain ATCC 10500 / CBS 375.48 / QM 6759 / NRRL 1006) TaxID=441959 RepID=B8MFA9_TALSN|nr:uncharacterized protein TSTA_013140 [Talaromyces stipitatus ATCC 10500]EED16208.1 hypothetical protein TSTA_013140 [Talaromyces stipitatus ATCC 10500]